MEDLHAAIEALAQLNDDPGAGGVTREVFTPRYREAVDLTSRWMQEAGLEPRLDAFGNLWGRWEGREPDAPRVLTGSHVDTTLNAGRYDGTVGVLGAIAAVHALRARGFAPRRTLEVIAFAGEEPRFGQGCIGSRAMTGALADPATLVDRDGVSLEQALRDWGLDPAAIGDAVIDPATVHAFVELHIEQGIVLESGGEQIGVVEAIAAPHDLRLAFTGAATHAGATPMRLRRDALVGAAEAIVAVERLARGSSSGTTVGTVGVVAAEPGAINIVPGTATLDVDVRDSDLQARDAVVEALLEQARAIARERELALEVTEIVRDAPVTCAPEVVAAASDACEALGFSQRRMISGAYHDALLLGYQVPVAMVFVPSRGGVSHHPDEFTPAEDVDRGVAVLAGTLERLAA